MPGPLIVAQTYNSPHPRSQDKKISFKPVSKQFLFQPSFPSSFILYTLNRVYKLPAQLCHCAFCLVANKVAGPPHQLYYSFVGRAAPPPTLQFLWSLIDLFLLSILDIEDCIAKMSTSTASAVASTSNMNSSSSSSVEGPLTKPLEKSGRLHKRSRSGMNIYTTFWSIFFFRLLTSRDLYRLLHLSAAKKKVRRRPSLLQGLCEPLHQVRI